MEVIKIVCLNCKANKWQSSTSGAALHVRCSRSAQRRCVGGSWVGGARVNYDCIYGMPEEGRAQTQPLWQFGHMLWVLCWASVTEYMQDYYTRGSWFSLKPAVSAY